MSLSKWRERGQPVISLRIKRRRLFSILALIILVLFSGLLVTSKYLNSTSLAADTALNADNFVVGTNDMLYIGMGGYLSQRPYSTYGQPVLDGKNNLPNLQQQLPPTTEIPGDGIYSSAKYNPTSNKIGVRDWQNTCPGKIYEDNSAFNHCYALLSRGEGMILKATQQIDIYGTVYVAERVVLDAPNIIIHDTARIYAQGQDSQLGWHDSCGAGGIGGNNGGSSGDVEYLSGVYPDHPETTGPPPASDYYPRCDIDNTEFFKTRPGRHYNGGNGLNDNSDPSNPVVKAVADAFFVSGENVSGGRSGASTSSVIPTSYPGVAGVGGSLGVGGGGGSGATGNTNNGIFEGQDHGSSGGGGGGFGLVFQAKNKLETVTGAVIDASGGNSLVGVEGTPLADKEWDATSGFGGPGGGGSVVLDTTNVVFSNATGSPTTPNYSVFNVDAGRFLPNKNDVNITNFPAGNPETSAKVGALIIKQTGYSRIVKKVVPYNVDPGGIVTVTLTLPVSSGFNVDDEFLNNGATGSDKKYFEPVIDGPHPRPEGCSMTDYHLVCPGIDRPSVTYYLRAPA